MTLDALSGPDPGTPSFAPVADHPGLRSDTPIVAGMLMEDGGAWRELAAFIVPSVTVRLASDFAAPDPMLVLLGTPRALEPSAVFDPTRPAWQRMRDDWIAREAGEIE